MERRRKTDLGAYVSFAKLDDIGQEIYGHGHVTGTFLSADRHPMVHIMADGKQHSIDECAVNLTQEAASAYLEHKRRYNEKVTMMVAAQRQQTTEYNEELARFAGKFLGAQIEMEKPPEPADGEAVH